MNPVISAPRRILFVSTLHAHWGGSEWLWSETALHLAKMGHNVAFFQPWLKQHRTLEELRAAKAREFCALAPERWYRRLWQRFIDRRLYFERMIDDFRPDLVVISQARQDEGIEWHAPLAQYGVPFVILNELVVDALYLEDDTARQILDFYQAAARLYFVSTANRRTAELLVGSRFTHADVVRNPVRVPVENDLPSWPQDEGVLRLALAGRLDPDQKGHDILFEVLARPEWRNRPIWLHLYGTGSGRDRLIRAKSMLGLERVVFEGFAENPAEIWRQSHVVAIPSRQEGMPIAMVEGMLMGRPVLGTAVAGIPEFVRDGIDGFLAEACTVKLLHQAMTRLWDARDHLREMGQEARTHALSLQPENPAAEFGRMLMRVSPPNRN